MTRFNCCMLLSTSVLAVSADGLWRVPPSTGTDAFRLQGCVLIASAAHLLRPCPYQPMHHFANIYNWQGRQVLLMWLRNTVEASKRTASRTSICADMHTLNVM